MVKRFVTPFLFALILILVFAWVAKSAASPRGGASISVTSNLDETGSLDCTLRDAITTANSGVDTGGCVTVGGGSPITISLDVPGPYTLTFTNSLTATIGVTGLPNIVSDIVLDGNGEKIVRSFAPDTPNFRILFVEITGTLQLRNVTLQNGYSAGVDMNGSGGGVFNMGQLSLYNTIVVSNTALGTGGGGIMNYWDGASSITPTLVLETSEITENAGSAIYSTDGSVLINSSTIYNNNGVGFQSEGGMVQISLSTLTSNGILNGNGGGVKAVDTDLTVVDTTVSENASSDGAGGLAVNGPRTLIFNTTINDNVSHGISGSGGGVSGMSDKFQIINSTISGNTTDTYGGGLFIEGTITITHVTISGNSAGFEGDGIYSEVGSLINLFNTIITDHPDEDCFLLGSIGGTTNLIDSQTCGSNPNFRAGQVSFFDPILADNGGPTWTHAILSSSNAVDSVDCYISPDTDQRGVERPQDGDGDGQYFCDIGAFEIDSLILPTNTPSPTPTITPTPTPGTPPPDSNIYLPILQNKPSAP